MEYSITGKRVYESAVLGENIEFNISIEEFGDYQVCFVARAPEEYNSTMTKSVSYEILYNHEFIWGDSVQELALIRKKASNSLMDAKYANTRFSKVIIPKASRISRTMIITSAATMVAAIAVLMAQYAIVSKEVKRRM